MLAIGLPATQTRIGSATAAASTEVAMPSVSDARAPSWRAATNDSTQAIASSNRVALIMVWRR